MKPHWKSLQLNLSKGKKRNAVLELHWVFCQLSVHPGQGQDQIQSYSMNAKWVYTLVGSPIHHRTPTHLYTHSACFWMVRVARAPRGTSHEHWEIISSIEEMLHLLPDLFSKQFKYQLATLFLSLWHGRDLDKCSCEKTALNTVKNKQIYNQNRFINVVIIKSIIYFPFETNTL